MQPTNPGTAYKPMMGWSGQLENTSTVYKQHSATSWWQESWTRCSREKLYIAITTRSILQRGDAAWPRMGSCALLQCLTASPVWRNQSTPSLTWSAKEAKCFQAIINIEKLGIFSFSLSFYFIICFSICDLHFYCWQMAEQYPGNITRQSLQEQKAEHTVFFQSVLGVTSREQLLDSLVQFLNPLLHSLTWSQQ